jgi:stalled ribosome alternative rescue factor ArfA
MMRAAAAAVVVHRDLFTEKVVKGEKGKER